VFPEETIFPLYRFEGWKLGALSSYGATGFASVYSPTKSLRNVRARLPPPGDRGLEVPVAEVRPVTPNVERRLGDSIFSFGFLAPFRLDVEVEGCGVGHSTRVRLRARFVCTAGCARRLGLRSVLMTRETCGASMMHAWSNLLEIEMRRGFCFYLCTICIFGVPKLRHLFWQKTDDRNSLFISQASAPRAWLPAHPAHHGRRSRERAGRAAEVRRAEPLHEDQRHAHRHGTHPTHTQQDATPHYFQCVTSHMGFFLTTVKLLPPTRSSQVGGYMAEKAVVLHAEEAEPPKVRYPWLFSIHPLSDTNAAIAQRGRKKTSSHHQARSLQKGVGRFRLLRWSAA
jgi:hypothetical protein